MTQKKDINEKIVEQEEIEVEAAAVPSVSVTLSKGGQVVKSSRINLLQGAASLSAKHTGGNGKLKVEIVDPTFIDETIKSWTLKPGESINYFALTIPKNTYYLRLSCNLRNATGTGKLGSPLFG
ncbi:hypothetical protein [Peribacillus muralis]|uniref:hypothetical protein n=1 Tax=Peribacillus muralis TaxID=264697 RepID=UPI003CFDF074